MRGLEKSNLALLHGQDLAAMINLKNENIFAIVVIMAGISLADSLEENYIEHVQKDGT